jgi:predicted transcriptional regulator
MSEQDLGKKIEELEKKVEELSNQMEKVKGAVKSIAEILDKHIKGQWTLEDIQNALTHINTLVSLLQQSGIIKPGEGGGNLMQMMLAQQMLAQRQTAQENVEVEPLKKKEKKKLKKFLEDEEEE